MALQAVSMDLQGHGRATEACLVSAVSGFCQKRGASHLNQAVAAGHFVISAGFLPQELGKGRSSP